MSCATPATESYLQCLQSNVDCEEAVSQDCDQMQAADLAACPALPSATQAALTACVQ